MITNYFKQSNPLNRRSICFDNFYSPQSNQNTILVKHNDQAKTLKANHNHRYHSIQDKENSHSNICFPELNSPHRSKFKFSLKKKPHQIDEAKKRWVKTSSKDIFTTITKTKTFSLENINRSNELASHYAALSIGREQRDRFKAQNSLRLLPLSDKMANMLVSGSMRNAQGLTITEKLNVGLPLVIKDKEEKQPEEVFAKKKDKVAKKQALRNHLILKCKNSNPGILRFIK